MAAPKCACLALTDLLFAGRWFGFQHSYFRPADLRGVDSRRANLEGASINNAQISGAYFPPELSPEEITLYLTHGTRMRYRK